MAERFLPMASNATSRSMERRRGKSASDGGYASLDNLKQAKAPRRVRCRLPQEGAPLTIENMVKSRWVYRKLKKLPGRPSRPTYHA